MPYLDPEDRVWKTSDPMSGKNPEHYRRHHVDLYNITKNHNFSRGNVIKYVDRAGYKPEGDIYKELEDLEKARWFLNAEIEELRLKSYDSLVKTAEPVGEIYDPGDDLAASEYAPKNYVPKSTTQTDIKH